MRKQAIKVEQHHFSGSVDGMAMALEVQHGLLRVWQVA
jgi:hypothetical protein